MFVLQSTYNEMVADRDAWMTKASDRQQTVNRLQAELDATKTLARESHEQAEVYQKKSDRHRSYLADAATELSKLEAQLSQLKAKVAHCCS
jgi:hypothetical protein